MENTHRPRTSIPTIFHGIRLTFVELEWKDDFALIFIPNPKLPLITETAPFFPPSVEFCAAVTDPLATGNVDLAPRFGGEKSCLSGLPSVPNIKGELGFNDGFVGAEVVGLDDDGAVNFEGDQSLCADHACAGRVYGPGDPAVGLRWSGHVGYGERGIGRIVGVVKDGSEGWEVRTVGEDLFGRKLLR
ncbi:Cytochrome b561 and DOMON domain-containing protein [Senna tora]|uniref:Cytochrome b561 and DOMON domain-containing protein n=1 Tax=Senna tora TaxID=362788 RepID=A0A834XHM5_9FABA|nr:Cytochrome b561 and DOMON domain-containing protein [Senna tora]